MEAKDVIHLLRMQRHDLMNDLQIVHGYLSMGKVDKVKAKLNEIIEASNRERVLTNSNCPNFALWLLETNLVYNHINFSYDIHTKNKQLQAVDLVLTNIGNTILEIILAHKIEIVSGNMLLRDGDKSIELVVTLNDQSLGWDVWKNSMSEKLNNMLIQVQEMETGVTFIVSIPV